MAGDRLMSDALAIKVAVATKSDECVDQHFGSARQFVVKLVSADRIVTASTKAFPKEAQDGNEDKLVAKLDWLREEGVDAVVCVQVGQSAARQLLAAGTQPLAMAERPLVADALAQLQRDMAAENVAWLTRLLKKKRGASARIDGWLDDEWDEED